MPNSTVTNIQSFQTNPQNKKVFEDVKTAYLLSHGSDTVTVNFTPPTTLSTGTYTVRTEVWHGTQLVSSASVRFVKK